MAEQKREEERRRREEEERRREEAEAQAQAQRELLARTDPARLAEVRVAERVAQVTSALATINELITSTERAHADRRTALEQELAQNTETETTRIDTELQTINGNITTAEGNIRCFEAEIAEAERQIAVFRQQIRECETTIATNQQARNAAEQQRADLAARQQQRMAELRAEHEMELARLAQQRADINKAITDARAAETEAVAGFAGRGLEALTPDDVLLLMRHLRLGVDEEQLVAHEIDGTVLAFMPESEMEEELGLANFCDRRRLFQALERLKNHQAPVPAASNDTHPVYGWTPEQAAEWAEGEDMPDLAQLIRKHKVPGLVLVDLSREDLKGCLGLTSLKELTTAFKAVTRLRKTAAAGEVVRNPAAAGGVGNDGELLPPHALLAAILEENEGLQRQLDRLRERNAAASAQAAAVPPSFICPITQEIMEEPVFASDGHTYERIAIEAWFRQRQVSPLTNLEIPPMLIPNHNLRGQIMEYLESLR